MSRLAGATDAIRQAIGAATGGQVPSSGIRDDDDLVDELKLDPLELESLGLILEEKFAIVVPDELWNGMMYRTAASLAAWCIRKSDEAAWAESQRQRKRA